MLKKIILFFCLLLILTTVSFAQDKDTDSLDDFSKIYQKSENIIITQDDMNGIYTNGDISYVQRSALSPEWISYQREIPFSAQVTAYFWPGEAVDHFSFYVSSDHENWREAPAKTEIVSPDGEAWIQVEYQITQTKQTDRYFKIEYKNLKGTSWTPMLNEVSFGEFLGEYEIGFSDMKNHTNQKAAEVVSSLGILNGYQDGTFRPEYSLTRAELARILSNIVKSTTEFYGVFSDVPKTHWAAKDIEALYRMGILGGYGNRIFAPEDSVTKIQATKAIVALLGYSEIAEADGGYPTGYTNLAFSLGFLKNTSLAMEEYITRGEFVQMLYQVLEIDMAQKSFSTMPNITVAKEITILSYYLNATKHTGIIYANEYTRLTGNNPAPSGMVEINQQYYYCGKTNISKYLGYMTEFYTITENDKDTVVYFSALGNEVTISDKDFLHWNQEKIFYQQSEEKESYVRITPETRVIFNEIYDRKIGEMDLSSFSLPNGSICLIDHNGDRVYEVIKIRAFDTYYIKTQSVSEKILYDYTSGETQIGLENVTHLFVYENDCLSSEEKLKFQKDDVVEILKSKDNTYAEIYITRKTASGILKEKQTETLFFDENSYRWNTYFQPDTVTVGEQYMLFLDRNNQIVFANTEAEMLQYGLYIGYQSGNFEEISIKLMEADGTISVYPLHHKIIMDNSSFSSPQAIVQKLNTIGIQHGQLIKFRKNSENIIKEILLSQTGELAGAIGFYQNYSGTIPFRGGVLNTFLGTHRVSANTKIFALPSDITDEKAYQMKAFSDFLDGESYEVEIYDTDEEYEIQAIVLHDKKTYNKNMASLQHLAVVDKLSRAVNQNNEDCWKLYFSENGIMISKYLSERLEYFPSAVNTNTLPKQGDIIQYTENVNGEIETIRYLGTPNSNQKYEFNIYIAGDVYSAFGEVSHKFSDRMFLLVNGIEKAVSLSSGNIYLLQNNILKPISAEEILIGDTVALITQETQTKLILIIR